MPQTWSEPPNFGSCSASGGTSSFLRTANPDTSGCGVTLPGAELAVSNAQWATARYGLSMGDGPRFEMYVYAADLDGMLSQLGDAGVPILREPEDMPWGKRIPTVADTEGNPVALCQHA
jgi:uncharacterized glyoxalase superfamily protein PhnB